MSDEASPIRILVADDHPIVREGVAALVERWLFEQRF